MGWIFSTLSTLYKLVSFHQYSLNTFFSILRNAWRKKIGLYLHMYICNDISLRFFFSTFIKAVHAKHYFCKYINTTKYKCEHAMTMMISIYLYECAVNRRNKDMRQTRENPRDPRMTSDLYRSGSHQPTRSTELSITTQVCTNTTARKNIDTTIHLVFASTRYGPSASSSSS